VARRKASQPSPAMIAIATLVGTTLASRVTRVGWRLVTGEEPPEDPSSVEADTVTVVLWAVVSATIVGVTRVMIRRGLAMRAANAVDEP
jgi:xanthosine utilization system XapX-like protein